MAIITLTTDWRNSDYYLGAIKGKILSKDQSVVIVDINHQITLFNTMQAAFVLRNCYREFPKGTIHLICVNSVLTPKKPLLIVEKDGQYFLCSDSGFPDLIFPEEEKTVYKVDVDLEEANSFSSLKYYTDVAISLHKGEQVEAIGQETKEYLHQIPLLPTLDTNQINGSVAYIDSYCNAITNINLDTFNRIGANKRFEIFVRSNHYKIIHFSKTYSEMPTGELVALFNSVGLLEIAIVNGSASELLNLEVNSAIRIKFNEKRGHNQLFLSGE